jgi:hypothetical protein
MHQENEMRFSLLPDHQTININGDTVLSVVKNRKSLINKVLQV